MNTPEQVRQGLAQLASHLREQRDEILDAWRAMVEQDPSLQDTSEWTAAQFVDHFPEVLDGFERLLLAWPDPAPGMWRRHLKKAESHARFRWLQGYSLRTISQEWGYFNRCVVARLTTFRPDAGDACDEVLHHAHQIWAGVLDQHLTESVNEYHHLLQAEAGTRAQELSEALARVRELEKRRSEVMHGAAREIRSELSLVLTTASVLDDTGLDEAERDELRRLFQSGFASLDQALDNLVRLAQLEAGSEQLAPAPLDAGEAMTLACAALVPIAEQQNVELRFDGPGSLPVEGDATRIPLLVRHLLLAAVPGSRRSTIDLRWGEDRRSNGRWFINLRFNLSPSGDRISSPTASVLSEATRDAHQTQRGSRLPLEGEGRAPAATSPLGTDGVHLAIAKRLCELLEASLELEAIEGGLQYRVTLPRTYSSDLVPR
ncbi:sensor histidine kinase [Lysobacter korlensis]|uniref:histidine kinase n=1 Tax=Lysobacter korlensis TaxID=553636 RepID=A0ABV6RS96_9GAMM